MADLPFTQAQPPQNPLTTLKDIVGITGAISQQQNLANQQRLFEQEFAAKQAVGEIARQSVDDNGNFQPEKFYHGISSDPRAAFIAPGMLFQMMQRELTMSEKKTKDFERASKAYDVLNTRMLSLMPKGDSVTHKDLDAVTEGLVDQFRALGYDGGFGDPKVVAKALGEWKKIPEGPVLAEKLRQLHFQTATAQEKADLAYGKQSNIDLGNRIAVVGLSQYPGVKPREITTLGKGLTPSEAREPIIVGIEPERYPNGEPNPAAGRPIKMLKGGVGNPAQPPGSGPGNNLQNYDGGGGEEGNPLTGQQTAELPKGAFYGDMGPGERKFSEERNKDVADYKNELDKRVVAAQAMSKYVGKSLDAMKHMTTGGGAEFREALGRTLQSLEMGGSRLIPQETIDKLFGNTAAYQVFDKNALNNMMTQLRTALQGVGGSRINMQEFIAFAQKNPNLLTDERAIKSIFGMWLDFYKRDLAEQEAYEKFSKPSRERPNGGAPSYWPQAWAKSEFMKDFSPTRYDISEDLLAKAKKEAGSSEAKTPAKSLNDIFGIK